jgi:LCP family protein required for cell wall assembly
MKRKLFLSVGRIPSPCCLGIDRTVERESLLDGYRSDTIALLRMQLDTKTINVLLFPRDTYTYVPIEGKMDKINHAYAYGDMQGTAVESTSEAVQELVKGLPIDYYMVMDMEPIPNIVDDIGGVVLDVDCDMKTYWC